jgi:hypothetical protein
MRLLAAQTVVVAVTLFLSGCQAQPSTRKVAEANELCSSILQWSKESIAKDGSVDILRFGLKSENIETGGGIYVESICQDKRFSCELQPHDIVLIKSISNQISHSSPRVLGEAARLCFSSIKPKDTLAKPQDNMLSEPIVGFTEVDQRTILTNWFPWRCQDNSNIGTEGCFGVAILPVADTRVQEFIEPAATGNSRDSN